MNTKKMINLGVTDFNFNLFVISIQWVKQKDSVPFCLEIAEFICISLVIICSFCCIPLTELSIPISKRVQRIQKKVNATCGPSINVKKGTSENHICVRVPH